MSDCVLSPDTQAILLLCASFGQNRQLEPQPLTLSEYNSLADWLRSQQLWLNSNGQIVMFVCVRHLGQTISAAASLPSTRSNSSSSKHECASS